MRSSGSGDGGRTILVLKLPHPVREGTAGKDDGLGTDIELLAGQVIPAPDSNGLAAVAEETVATLTNDANHLGVVCHGGAFLGCRQGDIGGSACVIVLALVEDLYVLNILIKLGELSARAALSHNVRRGAGEACQRVVELKDGRKGDRGEGENRVTEGSRPCDPGFHGHRDGNPVGEVGIVLQEALSLFVCTHDHLELAKEAVDLVDGVGQGFETQQLRDGSGDVADTGPDQLGGAAGRLISEVAPLDEGSVEAAHLRVEGDAGTGGSTTDDEDIVLLARREAGHLLVARGHGTVLELDNGLTLVLQGRDRPPLAVVVIAKVVGAAANDDDAGHGGTGGSRHAAATLRRGESKHLGLERADSKAGRTFSNAGSTKTGSV